METRAERYRYYAARCECLAAEVTSVVVRTQLKEAAEVWRTMADQVEQLDRPLSERVETEAVKSPTTRKNR